MSTNLQKSSPYLYSFLRYTGGSNYKHMHIRNNILTRKKWKKLIVKSDIIYTIDEHQRKKMNKIEIILPLEKVLPESSKMAV